MDEKILPMSPKFGIGFTSKSPVSPEMAKGYRYEQIGIYHNYHVTSERWLWPIPDERSQQRFVIDGFSPNLNKELHVGHLRNLAIATSLSRILSSFNPKFVALLGCSLGVKKAALEGWKFWTKFVGYYPEVYYDVVLPTDVIETHRFDPSQTDNFPQYWTGPDEEILVIRSDGRPLYSLYELVFAKEVNPTHYITGAEQLPHFQTLGLGDKHLPMGLVLGDDGKKLKSRTGDALPAADTLTMIQENLKELRYPEDGNKLAWNILAWNMLHAARPTNLKFDVAQWVRPESPGMYISYTCARIFQALEDEFETIDYTDHRHLSDEDIKLLGFAEQLTYHRQRAIAIMDPSPIANFVHDLAKALSSAYESERIAGGRHAFQLAVATALLRLEEAMGLLGMFILGEI